ncbi:AlpA family transcriptional regulator [Rhodobacter sp. SY28-1]|uniref:helix-turn-helix transcriptional regulator n=1 Tax=Rhodobacter sp. SY28-1 TaxID=2562317 RepID=UPI0010C138D6|nr:AlpA family phage regulatory protein [Rhodobacter sp. SY28-1]
MTVLYVSDIQLASRYGVHRATIWRWTRTDSDFPKPMKLSQQCSRWKLSEIEAWEAGRPVSK